MLGKNLKVISCCVIATLLVINICPLADTKKNIVSKKPAVTKSASSKTQNAQTKDLIKDYKTFYQILKSNILKQNKKFTVKVYNYKESIYDTSKAFDDIMKTTPKLTFFIEKYKYEITTIKNITTIVYTITYKKIPGKNVTIVVETSTPKNTGSSINDSEGSTTQKENTDNITADNTPKESTDINSGEKITINNNNDSSETKTITIPTAEQAAEAIGKYSSDGEYILDSVSKMTKKNIRDLIEKWKTDGNIFQTINTTVHEECHEYQSVMTKSDYDSSTDSFISNISNIINSKLYVVGYKEQSIFKSEEMSKDIPAELRTFRYSDYIAPGVDLTSNLSGVYGMLREFEAYYYGDKAVYDSYKYLLDIPYSEKNWLDYYASLDGTGFYEFEFFTLRYLIYAKQNHPDVYNSIINNDKYKTVFKYIHNNYKEMVENLYPQRIKEMCEYLKDKGINADYDGKFLFINGNGISGGGDVASIINEMKKQEYTSILNALVN